KEEMEAVAKTDKYVEKAYNNLVELSADELKRLEYEEREKAIRDYNHQMKYQFLDGKEEGIEKGIKEGKTKNIISLVIKKLQKAKSREQIADELEETLDTIDSICNIAEKYAPEYDIDKIHEEYQSQLE
ncbi:MAG: hypothetical protein Q4B70_16755, partial [Lachnospiraceae bacterium]|nr:hypothetical protein [Lachnospiraceae bacterium]